MIRSGHILLTLSLVWFALVAWLILRAWGQRGALPRVVPAPVAAAGAAEPVAVIVPARDESANIEPCVRSLQAQRYPPERLRIVVIDDASSDDTAAIVARLAAEDPRITLLHAPALPPGWKGKVHASWFGVQSLPPETPWLCFLDADMRAHPLALASALRAAQSGAIDLLTLAPQHDLRSFAERLILPCGLYLLGFSQDLTRIQAPDSDQVVATGQFMLIRRSAYDAIGGYAIVRESICEDVDLALGLKRRGFRVLMQDGSAVLSTRMYTGWGTLWPGIAKNLIEMLGGAPRTLATALCAVLLAWAAVLLPLLDALGCSAGRHAECVALVPALLGAGALFGLHLAGALHFGIPWWYGLIFPIGYATGACIALDSVRWRLVGRVHWKGRTYP